MEIILEEWRDISLPGLELYQVSNLGGIRRWVEHKKQYLVPKKFKRIGQGKNYKSIVVKLNGLKKRYSLHRLIAIAFLPIPDDLPKTTSIEIHDGYPYVVNHKDGNRSNNRSDNLEWTNHSGNNKHATKTGMRSSTIKIICKDLKTNQETLFNTVEDLMLFLNVSHLGSLGCKNIVALHKEKPYQNRYIFTLVDEDAISRYDTLSKIPVMVKDYVKGDVVIYKSHSAASLITGVKIQSLTQRSNDNGSKPNSRMLAGYDFINMKNVNCKNPPKWLDFSKEEASESRERYFSLALSGKRNHAREKIVEVTNVKTGEKQKFFSLKEAAKANNYIPKYVSQRINNCLKKKIDPIFKNHKFEYV